MQMGASSNSAVSQRRSSRSNAGIGSRTSLFRLSAGVALSIGALQLARHMGSSVVYHPASAPTSSPEAFAAGPMLAGVKRHLRLNGKERKQLKGMVKGGQREADHEFHILTEKCAWADFVEAQLTRQLSELNEESELALEATGRQADAATWEFAFSELAAPMKDRASALQTTIISLEKARQDLTNAIDNAEKQASKRAAEVEEITGNMKYAPRGFRELAMRAARPVTDGRLLEVMELAKTKIEVMQNGASEAKAASEATEKLVEEMAEASRKAKPEAAITEQAIAEEAAMATDIVAGDAIVEPEVVQVQEEPESMMLQLVGAAAAVVLAISAYTLVMKPSRVSAVPKPADVQPAALQQAAEVSAVVQRADVQLVAAQPVGSQVVQVATGPWDECELGEPKCVEIEVKV